MRTIEGWRSRMTVKQVSVPVYWITWSACLMQVAIHISMTR